MRHRFGATPELEKRQEETLPEPIRQGDGYIYIWYDRRRLSGLAKGSAGLKDNKAMLWQAAAGKEGAFDGGLREEERGQGLAKRL
jgi:hypothetical protein